jgi:hypothetical protein
MTKGLLKQAHAQVDTSVIANPLGDRFTTLADVFGLATNLVIGVGIALTVIFLVIGGIKYVTSQGDVKAADEARGALTNAVIGFVVVLAAFTIKLIVGNILNPGAGGTVVEDVTPGGL